MLKIKPELHKFKFSLIVSVILAAALLFVVASRLSENQHLISSDDVDYVHINNCKFKVEMADTPRERFLGLGNRDEICQNCGMLFEFPQKGDYSFCMRDMKFPLDFIWILDYNVVSVVKNVPYNFEGNINPHISVDKVLELNAGTAEKCGIKKGDKISY